MATTFPIRLKSDIGKPKAVFAVQATDSTGRGAAVGVPGWDWDGKDQVLIRSLPALANGTYTVTFLLLGG